MATPISETMSLKQESTKDTKDAIANDLSSFHQYQQ